MENNKDILDLDMEEISNFVLREGEKKFRAKQIFEWLHKHVILSYEDMHNVPKALREALNREYPLSELKIKEIQESKDGTNKFLLECVDGNSIESVLITNEDGRLTACISTQVGCPMQCEFCATGKQGYVRNLDAQEIYFQVAHMSKHKNERIDNIVVMGQGEPFLNYENTLRAITRLNEDDSLKIAARKITVSTCGILEGIKKFTEESKQFGLSVSLHSAIQATRSVIMPKTKNIALESLSEALRAYQEISNRRITFEYLLLDGVNDSEQECEAVIEFCKPFLCHVNLLHYNSVTGCVFKPTSKEKFEKFEGKLAKNGVNVSVRKSKGTDIDGACGQLANKKNVR